VFRGKGLADEAIVFALAAMPVLELRGAIPVGVWLGLPITKVRKMTRSEAKGLLF